MLHASHFDCFTYRRGFILCKLHRRYQKTSVLHSICALKRSVHASMALFVSAYGQFWRLDFEKSKSQMTWLPESILGVIWLLDFPKSSFQNWLEAETKGANGRHPGSVLLEMDCVGSKTWHGSLGILRDEFTINSTTQIVNKIGKIYIAHSHWRLETYLADTGYKNLSVHLAYESGL